MSYDKQMGLGHLIRKSNAHDTVETLTTSGVYGGYLITKPCAISEFKFYVTVATVGVGEVEVNRRPDYNESSTEILIATLVIPTGTAVGKVVSKRFEPVQLSVGDELSFECNATVATTGSGFYDVVLHFDSESDGNQSDLVTSA